MKSLNLSHGLNAERICNAYIESADRFDSETSTRLNEWNDLHKEIKKDCNFHEIS